jgi:hypothetical protein
VIDRVSSAGRLNLWFAAVAILVLSAGPSAAQLVELGQSGELREFRSEAGRFSVRFPGESPKSEVLRGSRFSATSNNSRHVVELNGAEFGVEIHDVPRGARLFLSSSFILDRAKLGMLDDIGGREIESQEISRQAQPGRLVVYDVPDQGLIGQLLLVLAQRRLYLVTVQHPAQEPPPAHAAFFESFVFWLE